MKQAIQIRFKFIAACMMMASIISLPSAAGDLPQVLFGMMIFSDTGTAVHVEGTIAGDGVAYKNNSLSLTCYRDTQTCLSVSINSLGLQVFSIGPPAEIPIQVWSADRIVADLSLPCGPPPAEDLKEQRQTTSSTTWLIDRHRQSAELVVHECLTPKTYHWTIEDPPFWKKAKDRVREPKHP